MTYLTHYEEKIKTKIADLSTLLVDPTESNIIEPPNSETLLSDGGFNQFYEYLTIQFDKRIGLKTSVIHTKTGPVFLRKQLSESTGNLQDQSLAHRSELYKIKALHSVKISFDYLALFLKDTDEQSALQKKINDIFMRYQALFDKADGSNKISQILEDFNHAIHHLFHKTLKTHEFDEHYKLFSIWSSVKLPAHDIITLDLSDNTFEIIANASSPSKTLYIEMAAISYFQQYNRFPLPSNLYRYLIQVYDSPATTLEEIEVFYEDHSLSLLDWYMPLSDDIQKIIGYYANAFLDGFISAPVQLSEIAHGDNATHFPAPLRNFHINLDGWLDYKSENAKVHISGIHFRSGAASRLGDQEITLQNTEMTLAAINAVSQGAKLSSAALLTDAVTTFSKVRYLLGGTAEPDTRILDAQESAEKKYPGKMKLKVSSIIMKTFSEHIGRHIQLDPYNMMESFKKCNLHTLPLETLEQEGFSPELLKAYSGIRLFVERYYKHVTREEFPEFIPFFQSSQQPTVELLRELKKSYTNSGNIQLLNHIRLLESVYTYTLLNLNHMKKSLFGSDISPVIETVIEHASPDPDNKMEHQHYHQWMLALESIIGFHFSLLSPLLPESEKPLNTIITSYYCKDGRDRTSLIAILIKTLHKMFDSQVSTLIHKSETTQRIDIQPLSMIPITQLDKSTQKFEAIHGRVVNDFSSAMLSGSPQSALGDYGLLSKLFGAGLGIVSSSVPPIRSNMKRITLPLATHFAKPYQHSHSFSGWMYRRQFRHMEGNVTESLELISEQTEQSLNRYIQEL